MMKQNASFGSAGSAGGNSAGAIAASGCGAMSRRQTDHRTWDKRAEGKRLDRVNWNDRPGGTSNAGSHA